MATLKLISYNVRGLNVAAKRHQTFRELKQAACSIAFLQETHLTHTTPVKLTSPHFPQWYCSLSDTNKAKGVAIGFSRSISFRLSDMLADDSGRFLFLQGFIGNTQCTLANVYCPNQNQPTFFSQILTKLSHFAKGLIILAGDINMSLDPTIDTSQGRSNISFKRLKFVKRRLMDLQLMDVWRLLHPKEKDFSHFSTTHHSYSRIDNIFLDHFHLPFLQSAHIGTATISDHAPVSMTLTMPSLARRSNNWKLNDSLLTNEAEVSILSSYLSQYFKENKPSDTSPSIVWEAHKATIRGRFIELGARKKREHGRRLEQVLQQIADLDKQHKLSLHIEHLQSLTLKREELKSLLNLDTKRKFQRISQKFFEWGNKPSRLLARSLKAKQTQSFIPKIKLPSGELAHATPDIAKAFKEFYADLYCVKNDLSSLPQKERRI